MESFAQDYFLGLVATKAIETTGSYSGQEIVWDITLHKTMY